MLSKLQTYRSSPEGLLTSAATVCLAIAICTLAADLRAEQQSAKSAAKLNQTSFPEFTYHEIDSIGSRLGQTALADVDRDGDLDWIAGQTSSLGGDIWWWEYHSPDRWERHVVGKGFTDVGGDVYDVNSDGWIDILAGSKLLINPGDPRAEPFSVHDVGTIHSHDTEFADINGDGRIDALANSDDTGLFWYEIPRKVTEQWPSHTIATARQHEVHGGVSPKPVGDIDGDGDADVVTGQGWYENVDGAGLRWKPHMNIDLGQVDRYGLAVRTWVGDLDGDDDMDVIQSEADVSDGRIAWFENDGQGNWTRHMIRAAGEQQDFHSLVVADFDGDGDMDVFSGTAPLTAEGRHGCYIWENPGTNQSDGVSRAWVEHLLTRQPSHEAVGGDVDQDGDIDICTKPWSTGNTHIFLRNTLRDAN